MVSLESRARSGLFAVNPMHFLYLWRSRNIKLPVTADYPMKGQSLSAVISRQKLMEQEKAASQKKLSILIPDELHRDLKTYAFRNQTTISDVVLGKIRDLLNSDHKQVGTGSQSTDERLAG